MASLLQCIFIVIVSRWSSTANAFKGVPVTSHVYEHTGFGNNPKNPEIGTTGMPRVRYMPPGPGKFFDSEGTPLSEDNAGLPSARRVMENLFRKHIPTQSMSVRSELLLYFGLLVSADTMKMRFNETEPFDIPCDGNLTDSVFCPMTKQTYCTTNDGGQLTPTQTTVYRAKHTLVQGADGTIQRATLNGKTTFLDMEFLYGSTKEQADKIRTFFGGQLDLVDNGAGKLPRDPTVILDMNTLPTLYSLIAVFMRFHNYIAKYTKEENPRLTDQEIYNSARNYVIGTYQKIVLSTYFPAITGNILGPYGGYDETVNPAIDEFMGAVAYRYAHTEQPNVIRLMDPDYVPTTSDPVFLRDAYRPSQPDGIARIVTDIAQGIEPLLRGATFTPKKPHDSYFVEDLNLWTHTSVLDIQRSRDLGIPPYNEVRRLMDLKPASSISEMVKNNEFGIPEKDELELVEIIENLYNDDVEKVDAYVGALFEAGEETGFLGPLLSKSFSDQFNRFRSGDRFWFENVFSKEEQGEMLTLADIIKLVCPGMDRLPWDAFAVWGTDKNEVVEEDCDALRRTSQVSLLGGGMTMTWAIEKHPSQLSRDSDEEKVGRTIKVTITANEDYDGAGYIGVGWRSRTMSGADIWICKVRPELFQIMPGSCNDRKTEDTMFSCCLARGSNAVPQCLGENDPFFYELEVIDWCMDVEQASVTVRADVCADDNAGGKTSNCFEVSSNADGTIDMIAAYNPSAMRPHGFQRRTSTVVDLKAGSVTGTESAVPQAGMIAYHAVTMMVFWMFLAPIGIFIVRYMKTKTWRLAAHIFIMGAVASLMVPILIGVEATVGATDKSQEHAVVGLALTGIVLPMFLAGRIRLLKLQGVKVGKKTAKVAHMFHKYTGYLIVLCSWWNCYTGLVRISPEDSNLNVVVFSSISLGYDIPIFGYIKDYIYVPYLGFVCFVFLFAEMRKLRLNSTFHEEKLKGVREGKSIWDDEKDAEDLYDEMTIEKLLELTRLGSNLCIIDGRVLDISGFMHSHPGGRDMLKTVAGSDITDEFVGLRDIEGFRHAHSYFAMQKMKSLIIARVASEKNDNPTPLLLPASVLSGTGADRGDAENPLGTVKINTQPVFRRARILDVRSVTPAHEISDANKPVMMLCLGVPKVAGYVSANNGFLLPSSAFKFRAVNAYGSTFEAYYTPVKLLKAAGLNGNAGGVVRDDENVYEFLIALRPGGQISQALLEWKIGKTLAIQGPTINPEILRSVASITASSVVTLFAAGTGIAPILQLLDYYTDPSRCSSVPNLFFIWILKGPEHNYSDLLGFEEVAEKFQGRLKWIVIYSSSKSDKRSKRGSARISTRVNGGVEFKANFRRAAKSKMNRVSTLRQPLRKRRKDIKETRRDSSEIVVGDSIEIDVGDSSEILTMNTRTAAKSRSSDLQLSARAALNGIRLLKARKRGNLDVHKTNRDPLTFSGRSTNVPSNALASDNVAFDGTFWRKHTSKALSIQLEESLIKSIIASINFHFEVESTKKFAIVDVNSNKKSDPDGEPFRDGSLHTSETDETETQNAPPDGERVLAEKILRVFQDSQRTLVTSQMVIFLCGSPRFDSNVRDWLQNAGIHSETIHSFSAFPNVHI